MSKDEETPEPEAAPSPAEGNKPEKGERKKKEEKEEEPKAPKAPKKLEGVKEDFRYIIRMANTDLDGTRSVAYALTSIGGVGIRVSEAVTDRVGVSRAERLGNLSEEQTDKIEATFGNLGEAFPHWMVNRPKDWESGLDLHAVGADVERMLSTGQRARRAAPGGNSTAPGLRLPSGPRNAGCSGSTACNPTPPTAPLGQPVDVCRRGGNNC